MCYPKTTSKKAPHRSFVPAFLVHLKRLGINISPYYFFKEALSEGALPSLQAGFEAYDFGFLQSENMKEIAAIPGRRPSEEDLLNRLRKGDSCFGIKDSGKLVAFTWCALDEANINENRFSLEEDEAYLYDAYTLMDYRGKGIAPFMRYQLYRELSKLGRNKLYSFSDYFNPPAIRFKEKLNAKFLELRLACDFRLLRLDIRLKKYGKETSRLNPLNVTVRLKKYRWEL